MTDAELHALAIECGAMVLGDEGSRQQYMLDLSQLAGMARAIRVAQMAALVKAKRTEIPPCPVPMPTDLC